jgi:hypothetical protein
MTPHYLYPVFHKRHQKCTYQNTKIVYQYLNILYNQSKSIDSIKKKDEFDIEKELENLDQGFKKIQSSWLEKLHGDFKNKVNLL